jgi:acetate kinase
VKILVPNLGSTSLKWRLFDFSNGAERVLHKGGFERVTNYAQAVEDCLAQLVSAGVIADEADLDAVGFKTIIAKNINGCVEIDEHVLQAMEAYAPSRRRTIRHMFRASVNSSAFRRPRRAVRNRVLPVRLKR